MIKQDIVKRLWQTHGGLTRAEAEHFTNLILEILRTALADSEPVTITRFGRFRHKKKKAREVVLPNGVRRVTGSGTRVQFIPAAHLKAALNADHAEPE